MNDIDIYWAIPMGNLNHRSEKAKERLDFYLNIEESDIHSCFYHIGKQQQILFSLFLMLFQ